MRHCFHEDCFKLQVEDEHKAGIYFKDPGSAPFEISYPNTCPRCDRRFVKGDMIVRRQANPEDQPGL
jgi:hypothetical protein